MSKMDQFVKAAEVMFALSRELGEDGIHSIDWSFTWHGTPEACKEIKERMDEALIRCGKGKLNDRVA